MVKNLKDYTNDEIQEQIKLSGEWGLSERKWALVEESLNRKLKGVPLGKFMDNIYIGYLLTDNVEHNTKNK